MESGIQTYKDVFELISYAVTTLGAIALIYGIFSYNLNKKQLNFAVLDRCIGDFQEKYSSISQTTKLEELRKYVDFVNEELFYFEQNYIPKAVAYEWIDGIIDILPIYDGDSPQKVLNPEKAIKKIIENNLLHGYQRVRNAFTIKRKEDYNFPLIYSEDEGDYDNRRKERERLVKEIYGNLR